MFIEFIAKVYVELSTTLPYRKVKLEINFDPSTPLDTKACRNEVVRLKLNLLRLLLCHEQ